MKQVASLRYGVIFRKAFGIPEIFNAFVSAVIGRKVEMEEVEAEMEFDPPIGHVAVKFDLYAEDPKNRVVVDIQHARYSDHYHRFLHYQCVALLEQVKNALDYRPNLAVYTIVVLTSGDRHKIDVAVTDFDPRDLEGQPLGEIPHKVIYICPKYVNENTPAVLREWLAAINDSLDEEVDEEQYTLPEIQHVFEVIGKDAVTPHERARMFEEQHLREGREEAFEEGVEKGLEEGREEGWSEARKEMALRMLASGLDHPTIMKYTGFSEETLRTLAREALMIAENMK